MSQNTNPLVAFDEAGNTGSDLLNPSQPVFVLASVCFSDAQAESLLKLARGQGPEPHFANLIRRKSGRERVLEIINSPLVSPETVKITACHKKFQALAQIVDLLIEPMLQEMDIDLYDQGGNIAMSNMLYYVLPTCCGLNTVDDWLHYFVRMMRARTPINIEYFYRQTDKVLRASKFPGVSDILSIVRQSRIIVQEILAATDEVFLDPAVPCFVQHCDQWGKQLGCLFDLVHDASKPLAREREALEHLMARDEPEATVGYDRRKVTYPLKATGLQLRNSSQCSQIQIADVFAGACACWLGGKLGRPIDASFMSALDESKVGELLFNGIWPSTEVSPEALGTEEFGGINPNDFVGDLLYRRQSKKMT